MFSAILACLIGFFGFSSISNYVTVSVLKLPIYLPEFLIVPGLLALYFSTAKSTRPEWTLNKLVLLSGGVAFWIVLVLLALDEGSIADALATGRGMLYGFLAAFLAKCLRERDISQIVWFSIGTLLAECLYAGLMAPFLIEDYRGIAPINVTAVFVAASASIVSKKPLLMILAISLCVLAILLAGFRAPVAALLFGIIFTSVLIGMRRGAINLLIAPMKALAILAVALAAGAAIVSSVIDVDPYAYQRVVSRSIPLLQGDVGNTRDSYRLEKIRKYALEEPGEIAPSGFVGKARGQMGNLNDAAFLNFTLTMGVPIGVLVMLILISMGALFFVSSLFGFAMRSFDYVAAAFFPFFLLILIINGRFAYIVYESIMVGMLIGYWFYLGRDNFNSFIKALMRPGQYQKLPGHSDA